MHKNLHPFNHKGEKCWDEFTEISRKYGKVVKFTEI